MNKINFTAKDSFPLSSDTLDLMQKMVTLSATMAVIGGSSYILSGCTDDGSGNISDGVIVIEGEILPFQGGSGTKITIEETSKTLNAFGVDYPEAYVYRVAKFSTSGAYDWADFERVSTNKQLKDIFQSIKGDAPGIIKMWAGAESEIPAGYLLCDGRELQIKDYPELYDALLVRYGGDGQNNFRLPDLRGKFVAGYYNGDPDYGTIGETGGKKEVELTTDNIPEHKHVMPWGENPNTAWNPPWGYAEDYLTGQRGSGDNDTDNAWAYTSTVGENKPHENRPPYFTLAYIIKVTA